ncbi:MAG TPA: hypothetical protein VGV90_09370 [Solirubrobacteraceae bacterium]|nr:hypothetical protein [Solirubrobacteraceae bacterium]
MKRLRTVLGWRLSPRAYWSVLDQAISSASNLAFIIVVARSVSVEAFGEFVIAYLVYALLLGGLRAVGGEILLLRVEEAPGEAFEDCRRLLGLAAGVGLIVALLTTPLGLVLGGTLGGSLAAFALMLPILLTQDALRYCFFALATPSRAAANDLMWLGVQALTTTWLLLDGDVTPVKAILAWAAGAAVAGAVGMRHARLVPTYTKLTTWITADRARVGGFFSDFVLMIGAGYFAIYIVALIGGVSAVAGVRGAMILFAPLDSVFAGVRIVTLSALAEAVRVGRRVLVRRAGVVALVSAAITAAWTVVILTLPRDVGTALLGPTWDVARPLCAAIAVASAARYVALPAQAGLRALNDTRRIVSLRVVQTIVTLGAVAVGTAEAGARGAAGGLAAAHCAGCALWARGFLRGASGARQRSE